MVNIQSPFIAGGGGYWHYDIKDNGTLWTQKNSVMLKNNFLCILLKPVVKWMMATNTKEAMKKAKKAIETI